jgi:hypothetical protein
VIERSLAAKAKESTRPLGGWRCYSATSIDFIGPKWRFKVLRGVLHGVLQRFAILPLWLKGLIARDSPVEGSRSCKGRHIGAERELMF